MVRTKNYVSNQNYFQTAVAVIMLNKTVFQPVPVACFRSTRITWRPVDRSLSTATVGRPESREPPCQLAVGYQRDGSWLYDRTRQPEMPNAQLFQDDCEFHPSAGSLPSV